jgi:hypothetical protein
MADQLWELSVAAGAELATRRHLQLNPATIAYANGICMTGLSVPTRSRPGSPKPKRSVRSRPRRDEIGLILG